MNIYELQKTRRTIRKFTEMEVNCDLLEKFVDHARLCASSRNTQSVRYMIITDEKVDMIFPYTYWAGYLKGQHSPTFDERPRAYILFLVDNKVMKDARYDVGAISHAIQLMAHSEGIGTCWLGSIDRKEIVEICKISDRYTLDTMLALGYPAEKPVIEDAKDNDIKYYKDEKNTLHVPKRTFEDVIIK